MTDTVTAVSDGQDRRRSAAVGTSIRSLSTNGRHELAVLGQNPIPIRVIRGSPKLLFQRSGPGLLGCDGSRQRIAIESIRLARISIPVTARVSEYLDRYDTAIGTQGVGTVDAALKAAICRHFEFYRARKA